MPDTFNGGSVIETFRCAAVGAIVRGLERYQNRITAGDPPLRAFHLAGDRSCSACQRTKSSVMLNADA